MKIFAPLGVSVLALHLVGLPISSQAQLVFAEDFETDPTPNWSVNASDGDHPVNFAFDYSTVGIPAAPNSAGATTTGLKMQANVSGGIFGGVSVSPINLSLSGDYSLQFDLWQNYNGPLNGGGSGSTQITGAGIGTAGTSAQWAGGTIDSVFFAGTGDAGSSIDFRAYSSDGLAADGSTVYAADGAGNRNHPHPYYSVYGGGGAPASQLALYAGQTGETAVGALGFAWHDVLIQKEGDNVTWTVDGLRLATMDLTGLTLGGGNILFMHSDINATSSADPLAGDLLFGLIDNVRVTVVPEPSTWGLFGLGLIGLAWLRRRRA